MQWPWMNKIFWNKQIKKIERVDYLFFEYICIIVFKDTVFHDFNIILFNHNLTGITFNTTWSKNSNSKNINVLIKWI